MKHWGPGHPRWRKNGRDTRFPPGWWIVPLIFGGLFFWAAVYLLIDWLIFG